jgi:hypothetical protein
MITDRNVVGSIDPESTLVSEANPYGDWLSHTERALAFDLENATDKFAINAPKFQITNVQEADRNGIVTDTISFQCNRSAAAGNDELTIVFSAP